MNDQAQDRTGVAPVHRLMPQAVALHRDGQLDEAAKLYLQISAEVPRDFDATHLLGVVALQQGRFEAAQKLLSAAVNLDTKSSMAMGNLGTSYMRDGQLQSALQWFELALKVDPQSVSAMINLGTVLHNMDRFADAMLVLRPAHALEPTSPLICNLLGVCLLKTGQAANAAQILAAATRSSPDNAEAWANLSVALNAVGRSGEANECADRAVSLNPQSSKALSALGAAQAEQGRMTDAIESYSKSVQAAPATADMLFTYGYALLATGQHAEAIAQFNRALTLDSKNLAARWASAIANLKPIYSSESDLSASRQAFAAAIGEVESWYEAATDVREPFYAVGASQPFYIAYQPYNNRALLARYGSICVNWMSTLGLSPTFVHATDPKVQLGIAAAHVHEHSVWNAITKGWVHHLDKDKVDIHIFQLNPTSDEQTDDARRIARSFTDKPSDLIGWAEAIKAKHLDVLIYPEIGMEPLTVRLASLRLAPIQAVSWGHPETSGLPTLDMYFSGNALEPPDADKNYSEKLVRLPNFGAYVEPLEPVATDPRLDSLGLPDDEPLLLCPGTPFKYTPANDDIWARIASRLRRRLFKKSSGGRLVFFGSRSESMDRMFETRLRQSFRDAGVDFDAHAKFVPQLDRGRFFGLMRQSALMLDTLDFSGFNTALQGIECDLPVLAYEGEFMRGRLASAILRRLELPELVATSKEEFVDKAVALAGDAGERKRLRKLILARRGELFCDLAPIRALEQELIQATKKIRPLPAAP